MVFGGIKKQPAWGHRVARLFREVSRRVTNALKGLESGLTPEFPAIPISLIFIEIRTFRTALLGQRPACYSSKWLAALRFISDE